MYLWVVLQINHICEQRTDSDIRLALKHLPQGLDKTFIRSLKKIDELPSSSRERLKRVLRWVVCAQRPLHLSELIEAVAIDEMADTWDPEKVVNDQNSLIYDCAHLLITHDGWFVQLIHDSVYNFLTSSPGLFDTPLPLYHVYPVGHAHAHIARNCFRYFTSLFYNDQALTHQSYFISYWLAHTWESGEQSQIFADLFNTRISQDPTHQTVIFPHVTHVKAINCTIYQLKGSQYRVFINPNDTDYDIGRPALRDIFPKLTHLQCEDCVYYRRADDSHQMMTYWSSDDAGTAELEATDLLRATHVTLRTCSIYDMRGPRFDIFPFSSTMVTCFSDDSAPFQGMDVQFTGIFDTSDYGDQLNFFLGCTPQIASSIVESSEQELQFHDFPWMR